MDNKRMLEILKKIEMENRMMMEKKKNRGVLTKMSEWDRKGIVVEVKSYLYRIKRNPAFITIYITALKGNHYYIKAHAIIPDYHTDSCIKSGICDKCQKDYRSELIIFTQYYTSYIKFCASLQIKGIKAIIDECRCIDLDTEPELYMQSMDYHIDASKTEYNDRTGLAKMVADRELKFGTAEYKPSVVFANYLEEISKLYISDYDKEILQLNDKDIAQYDKEFKWVNENPDILFKCQIASYLFQIHDLKEKLLKKEYYLYESKKHLEIEGFKPIPLN